MRDFGRSPEPETKWYVDAFSGSAAPIVASVHASPSWIQVSTDCGHGTRVSVSDPSVVEISSVIKASDGADVAVLISPVGAGHATLTVAGRTVMTFTVYVDTDTEPDELTST
jgi:hypothetical protein